MVLMFENDSSAVSLNLACASLIFFCIFFMNLAKCGKMQSTGRRMPSVKIVICHEM